MGEDGPHLTVMDSGDVRIVEFTDRKIIEELTISQIGDELTSLIASTPKIKLLLSFEQVEHLSSAALGVLIKVHHQTGDAEGKLRLSDITPQIYEVFKITRLNKLFDIYSSREEALADF